MRFAAKLLICNFEENTLTVLLPDNFWQNGFRIRPGVANIETDGILMPGKVTKLQPDVKGNEVENAICKDCLIENGHIETVETPHPCIYHVCCRIIIKHYLKSTIEEVSNSKLKT